MDDSKFTVRYSNESKTASFVTELFRTRMVWSKVVKEKCNEEINSRGKSPKASFFKLLFILLGYERVYGRRGTHWTSLKEKE